MTEKENNSYFNPERELNLIDLLWKLIYSWRVIIIWGIIFACLLSGMKYVKDSKRSTTNQTSLTESLRNGLTEDELLTLEGAIAENESIEQQLTNNTAYQKNSILMNIDPYNANQVVLQYYINSQYTIDFSERISQDYTQALLKSYRTYLTNGSITENFTQEVNADDNQYLAELIRIDSELDSKMDSSDPLVNTFCVNIVGKDMEQARNIADMVKQALESYQSELSAKIGAHELVLIDTHEQVVQDDDLAEKQAKLETTNYNLRFQQDSLKSKLSAQQLQILEQERKDKLSEKDETDVLTTKVGFSKKYAILGLFAGVFLICVLIALKYIIDAHIKSERELQEFYGLRIFGALDYPAASKKIGLFVDRWLDCISGRKKGILKEQLEITITNLLVTCKKAGIDNALFTTSIRLNDEEKQSADHIMEQMKQQGINVVFAEYITRDSQALTKMAEIGNVILLEKMNQTEYQELENELKLCQEQDAKVLGTIVIK